MVRLDEPRETLTDLTLVLDLDATLIRTNPNANIPELLNLYSMENRDLLPRLYHFNLVDFKAPRGKGKLSPISGIMRPNLPEFLDFICYYFKHIIVWSAGDDQYVQILTDLIFERTGDPPIVFGFSKCKPIYLSAKKTIYAKPLQQLIEAYPEFNLSIKKMLILDDNRDTFRFDNPDNAIEIPEYDPMPDEDLDLTIPKNKELALAGLRKDEPSLLEVMEWLIVSGVGEAEDVRLVPKPRFSQKIRDEKSDEDVESDEESEDE